MSQQFKSFVNGVWQLVSAIQSSAGVGDAGKIPALDSAGRLSSTMMPTGVGAETVSVVASEALTAGNFVNVYNNGGRRMCGSRTRRRRVRRRTGLCWRVWRAGLRRRCICRG